jgi:dienelactone hydrolase
VIGFSLGAGIAQQLAEQRTDVSAALLLHNARIPTNPERLEQLPLQVHAADDDPWVNDRVAQELVACSTQGELFRYPGSGHLFLDPGLPDFDPASAAAAEQRIRATLRSLDSRRN